jgi:hypothetical protein
MRPDIMGKNTQPNTTYRMEQQEDQDDGKRILKSVQAITCLICE